MQTYHSNYHKTLNQVVTVKELLLALLVVILLLAAVAAAGTGNTSPSRRVSAALYSGGEEVVSGPVQAGWYGKSREKTPNELKKSAKAPLASISTAATMNEPALQKITQQKMNLVGRTKPARTTKDNLWQILEEKLVSVDYNEMALADVMRELREELGINLIVYWPALQAAGIRQDDPVTLKLEKVSAVKVIESVLEYISSGKGIELGYQVDQGVVEVDLKENLKEKKPVQVYYIGDLLSPRSSIENSILGAGYGGGYGGGGGWGGGLSGQRGMGPSSSSGLGRSGPSSSRRGSSGNATFGNRNRF